MKCLHSLLQEFLVLQVHMKQRNCSLKTYIKRELVITDGCFYKTSQGQKKLAAVWNRAAAAQMGVSGQSSQIVPMGG